jgi:hypothetical protein
LCLALAVGSRWTAEKKRRREEEEEEEEEEGVRAVRKEWELAATPSLCTQSSKNLFLFRAARLRQSGAAWANQKPYAQRSQHHPDQTRTHEYAAPNRFWRRWHGYASLTRTYFEFMTRSGQLLDATGGKSRTPRAQTLAHSRRIWLTGASPGCFFFPKAGINVESLA